MSPSRLLLIFPSEGAICPLRSTATKLVRTFDNGREPVLSDPAGDRPREGGETRWLFSSNFPSRSRTLLADRPDMTVDQNCY